MLGEQSDPSGVRWHVDTHPVEDPAAQTHVRPLGPHEPGQTAQHGRLSRTVRTEYREHPAVGHIQRHRESESLPTQRQLGVQCHDRVPSNAFGRATAMTTTATTTRSSDNATALSTSLWASW